MIDLQIHTTDSDGTWTWEQALNHCKKIGLSAYAITDHDTIIRCDAVRAWAKENNQNAFAGIELSTREKDQTVHLLGYFLDGPVGKLKERLEYLRVERLARNGKIVEKLQQLGFEITEDQVKKVAGSGTIGRPHIARVLLEKGYVKSIKEAFNKFLSAKGAAYFPKEELPLKEAMQLLHEAGAVTSVAHPMLLARSLEEMEESIERWVGWGLDGLEGIYPMYTDEQTAFVARMATKYNLLITGGSDFHGDNKPHIKIGTGTGKLEVPDSLLEPLLKRRQEKLKHLGVEAK